MLFFTHLDQNVLFRRLIFITAWCRSPTLLFGPLFSYHFFVYFPIFFLSFLIFKWLQPTWAQFLDDKTFPRCVISYRLQAKQNCRFQILVHSFAKLRSHYFLIQYPALLSYVQPVPKKVLVLKEKIWSIFLSSAESVWPHIWVHLINVKCIINISYLSCYNYMKHCMTIECVGNIKQVIIQVIIQSNRPKKSWYLTECTSPTSTAKQVRSKETAKW